MRDSVSTIKARIEERGFTKLAIRCAAEYECTLDEMLGKSHIHPFTQARALFWACLRARGHWTLQRIGSLVDRHHVSIYHAVRGVPSELVERITRETAVPANASPACRVEPAAVLPACEVGGPTTTQAG